MLAETEHGVCSPPETLPVAGVGEVGAEIGPEFYRDGDFIDCEMLTLPENDRGYETGADAIDALPDLELKTE